MSSHYAAEFESSAGEWDAQRRARIFIPAAVQRKLEPLHYAD